MLAGIVKYSLFLTLLLIPAQTGLGQACGNIYAKFFVRDASERFVNSVKFSLLRTGTNDPIADVKKEISVLSDVGAYQFRHGLCGSHHSTRLVIEHPDFEKFDGVVDLPLNSPHSEHVFTITMKRKGTREIASLEQWAALTGDVTDAAGNRLGNVSLSLIGRDGSLIKSQSSSYGIFSFYVRQGHYTLEAQLPGNGKKVKYDEMLLKPGYNWRDVAFRLAKKN